MEKIKITSSKWLATSSQEWIWIQIALVDGFELCTIRAWCVHTTHMQLTSQLTAWMNRFFFHGIKMNLTSVQLTVKTSSARECWMKTLSILTLSFLTPQDMNLMRLKRKEQNFLVQYLSRNSIQYSISARSLPSLNSIIHNSTSLNFSALFTECSFLSLFALHTLKPPWKKGDQNNSERNWIWDERNSKWKLRINTKIFHGLSENLFTQVWLEGRGRVAKRLK